MDIASLNQAASQATTSSGTQALNQLGEDYTTFLQLLTAQISNQDPLEPIDSTQFVTQLAQLTQVEQTTQTNINLENLATKLDTMALTSGAALVGQEANFATNTLVLGSDGATASYQVASNAQSVVAEIYDPTGQLIRTIPGLPGEADVEHDLTWNGLSDTGQPALTGNYEVKLTATDAQGAPVETGIFRYGAIEEMNFFAGQVIYLVDGQEYVPSDSIRSLR